MVKDQVSDWLDLTPSLPGNDVGPSHQLSWGVVVVGASQRKIAVCFQVRGKWVQCHRNVQAPVRTFAMRLSLPCPP